MGNYCLFCLLHQYTHTIIVLHIFYEPMLLYQFFAQTKHLFVFRYHSKEGRFFFLGEIGHQLWWGQALQCLCLTYILGALSNKCPGFYKRLILLNMDLPNFWILVAAKSDQHSQHATKGEWWWRKHNKISLNSLLNYNLYCKL